MRLIYWAAKRLDDSQCYNIRERTRQEAIAKRKAYLDDGLQYGPVTKVEVEYQGGRFGLMLALLEEGAENLLPDDETQANVYRDLDRRETGPRLDEAEVRS